MKLPLAAAVLAWSCATWAQAPLPIPVVNLGAEPKIDGNLGEWGSAGWIRVPVAPALEKADRAKYGLDPNDDRNQTGSLTVQLKAGVYGSRLFVALKYPDSTEDAASRHWEWRNDKYVEGKTREDMFALRFHMSGDFDKTMLSTREYRADVWLWSAARTNPGGLAEDMTQLVTTRMIEDAAEYEPADKKTIYIKKSRDAGNAPYKLLPRPKEHRGDKLPSFETSTATGSAADVAARGRWTAGHWQLEFARALATGNADDAAFKPGQKILGQIAVFNQGYAEHKSVSDLLLFDFSAVK